MEAMGILPGFTGVAVHDFWSSYKKLKAVIHAMCCQHLECELVYAEKPETRSGLGSSVSYCRGCAMPRTN